VINTDEIMKKVKTAIVNNSTNINIFKQSKQSIPHFKQLNTTVRNPAPGLGREHKYDDGFKLVNGILTLSFNSWNFNGNTYINKR